MKQGRKAYYNNSKELIQEASKVVKETVKNAFQDHKNALKDEIDLIVENKIKQRNDRIKQQLRENISQNEYVSKEELTKMNLITRDEASESCAIHLGQKTPNQKTNKKNENRKFCNPR